jgi:hypothetical protein
LVQVPLCFMQCTSLLGDAREYFFGYTIWQGKLDANIAPTPWIHPLCYLQSLVLRFRRIALDQFCTEDCTESWQLLVKRCCTKNGRLLRSNEYSKLIAQYLSKTIDGLLPEAAPKPPGSSCQYCYSWTLYTEPLACTMT